MCQDIVRRLAELMAEKLHGRQPSKTKTFLFLFYFFLCRMFCVTMCLVDLRLKKEKTTTIQKNLCLGATDERHAVASASPRIVLNYIGMKVILKDPSIRNERNNNNNYTALAERVVLFSWWLKLSWSSWFILTDWLTEENWWNEKQKNRNKREKNKSRKSRTPTFNNPSSLTVD